MERYAHVTGWGMAVPERVMTNADLARTVDTSDEWIVSHTGIKERRIAGRETTASLSVEAARAALECADLSPRQIDLIIVATLTPEYAMPATACVVQEALGAVNAGAYDLNAACSGFVYALAMAANGIRAGMHKNVLVIGAETLSRVTNWNDRGTCILFGDGAGAFVVQASEVPGGVLTSLLRADGSGGDALVIPAGGSRHPTTFDTVRDNKHFIEMDGKEVYRFATRIMATATKEVVQDAGLTMDDIALIVPHQANRRIIDSAARVLNLPEDRFVMNIDHYGNTSSASIPMAVCEAVEAGRVRPNDHLVLIGFGGGLTWAATVLQWNVTARPEVSPLHRFSRSVVYGLSKLRSAARRGLRRVQGALTGIEPGEATNPPERSNGPRP